MCRYEITEPVVQSATETHPVLGTTFVARWVRLQGDRLAVGILAQSSGEEHVLDLRALECGSARGEWLAERILSAVTGR